MRILFLSNFYPPARPGGYTQWCQEVAERLHASGHTIGVLTSRHQAEKASAEEEHVYRLLHLDGDLVYYRPLQFFMHWKQHQRANARYVEQTIRTFAPDLVFVWGMWALSNRVPALAERLTPGRVVYYLSDYWPAAADMHTEYWQRPARRWYMRPVKGLLRLLASAILRSEAEPSLKFDHVICVSAAVRDILCDAGLPMQQARVIHGGTDVERFAMSSERTYERGQLNLLYAGQLVAHKGVHTAIEAVAKIVNERGLDRVRLTIVGSGHPEYEARLRSLVDRHDLHEQVVFYGAVDKEEMPALLRRFDVLVFPSVYEEPLARMTQEAMAAGMVVVGTTTGGTREILNDSENGLTFPAEDSAGLARQLARLASEPALCERLSAVGRQSVVEYFNLDRMVDEIEGYLYEVMRPSEPAEATQSTRRSITHANSLPY